MIKIFPEIDFRAKCPNDGVDLEITNVIIPGMRCLADATCPKCGTHYYVDLPVGQALWSPVTLNQSTAQIYDLSDMKWFSNPLKEGFLNPVESEVVPTVHKFFDSDRIIIVNCLDFLYGHSLLKLLNVQLYLDNSPELGCCVLVPTQLMHLVPEGVAEIWEFPLPIKQGLKWYPSLQRWINEQLTKRKECYLSPAYSHPSNKIYDLHRFVRDLPDISEVTDQHQPIILFNYREDRLWGRTLTHQLRNLQKLYNQLSTIFPDMAFVLVGFGLQNQIKTNGAKLIDLRANKFDLEQDRLWMAYMRASDCVIGVHGSNMLLPSGLAKSTVELLPRQRLGNIFQDILFPHDLSDIRDALLKYRFIYGNDSLDDIQATTITDVVVSILVDNDCSSLWFKLGESETNSFTPLALVASTAASKHLSDNQPKTFAKKAKRKAETLLRETLHQLDTQF